MHDEVYWYKCRLCGEIYDRAKGVGKHQNCENIMARKERTPAVIMRERWNRKKKKMAPRVFERDGNRCIACGTDSNLVVDHIVPIIKGGDNEIDNLQTLCSRCNTSKRDKTMSEWTGQHDQ